jgi:hypothetical protein
MRCAAALSSATEAASSICAATMCEWLATKLTRSSCPSTPSTVSPSFTTRRCTRWRTINHSASNSSLSGCTVTRSKRATSRTGS